MPHRSARVRFASVIAAAAALAIALPHESRAQGSTPSPRWVGTLDDEYRRLLQLTGAAPLSSRMIRPLARDGGAADSIRATDAWTNPWSARFAPTVADSSARGRVALRIEGADLRGTYNSAVPFGMNDGSLWAGRGVSGSVTPAASVRWSAGSAALTVRLAPTFAWSQNADFAIAPLLDNPPANASPYADRWWSSRIDLPQRFGADAYSTADFGQSSVRLDWRALALGAGTESMWWGPGTENSLLMTNNAAGFPHAYLGTGRPVDIWLGKVELMYMTGRLYDSQYWRTGDQPNRNRRWLNSLAGTFTPRGAPGLYLGAGRLFYEEIPAGGLGVSDFLDIFQPFQKSKLSTTLDPDGNDNADQMLALWLRWAFPEVGFEVYGEWGRNDHSRDGRDFLLEPGHSAASLLGVQKVFRQRGGFMLVRGEATSLARDLSTLVRPTPTWYVHGRVPQGYTERGQVIGAGIGPGSTMQSLAASWFRGWGSAGVRLYRVNNDLDAFYAQYADLVGSQSNQRLHDVTVGGEVRGTLLLRRGLDLSAAVGRQAERNRYTILQNDVSNWHLETRLAWHP